MTESSVVQVRNPSLVVGKCSIETRLATSFIADMKMIVDLYLENRIDHSQFFTQASAVCLCLSALNVSLVTEQLQALEKIIYKHVE